MEIKRGQIYYADLSPIVGSEQGGYRPVLIIQNDMGNKYSPTVITAIITTRTTKAKIPTHHWLQKNYGLARPSMVELEQIRTIDKRRLQEYVGKVDDNEMIFINAKIRKSLDVMI